MNQHSIPPPPPLYVIEPKSNITYGKKVLLLGLQCVLLMIGAFMIWTESYSRSARSEEVADEIVDRWGSAVRISGPTISYNTDSKKVCPPATLVCDANIGTESLHRNRYEAEVYTAHVKMAGTFNIDAEADSATMFIEIGDAHIKSLQPLKIGGKTCEWKKKGSQLCAKIDFADMPRVADFSTEFDVDGSSSFMVALAGEKSSVVINGEASNPSFSGHRLPSDRNIDGGKFTANWNISGISGVDSDDAICEYVGVDFLVGVDRYQKVARSLKYAFLIILLTYISVLVAEVMMKHYIPLLNYFLIGAALIIFYTLLLSFVEFLSFGLAYLIASAMTVLLIGGYMAKMLSSWKAGSIIGAILTLIYIVCFILLSLSTYSLMLGSIIIFFALAALMYVSLRIK